MSSDKHLYTDIASVNVARTMPQLMPKPPSCDDSQCSKIDKAVKDVQASVGYMGFLLGEMKPPLCCLDPIKKRAYESMYRSLVSVLTTTQLPHSPIQSGPILKRSTCESVSFGMTRSDSMSSYNSTPSTQQIDELEKAENDVFWSIVYDVFPEWKDKRIASERAVYFQRFLEKRNYDAKHAFRGKTDDIEFVRRMEFFLNEIDKRGLDWKKCMRKLKRRCCDLIRYERTSVSKTPVEMKRTKNEYSDYISLFGSIAKQNLSEIETKPIEIDQIASIIDDESMDNDES